MGTPLLDLIFLSEKRKDVLLLLAEGPKDLETLKGQLKASPTAIQPQIKKLKEQHLVTQDKNICKLTEIGKIVVEKMKPLIETLSMLEENADYLDGRYTGPIPPFLLRRICELGHCKRLEPKMDQMFELIPEFIELANKSKKMKTFFSYFHPSFPSFYLGLAKKGIPTSIILPAPILKRWVEDYAEITEQLLKLENTELFAFMDCEKFPTVIVTDIFTAIALFPKASVFDRKYVLSTEPAALGWGEELFEYYKKFSEPYLKTSQKIEGCRPLPEAKISNN